MVNKTPDIMEHIIDRDPSIVFLQETWLKTNRSITRTKPTRHPKIEACATSGKPSTGLPLEDW